MKHSSNLVKPHWSDKLEDQAGFIQSFNNKSTYEMLHCVITFRFIFIMAKGFPVDVKPRLGLMIR